ncbi:alpha/beta hydrolase [Enterococcus ureasiticus]|uniref:alpha/beta hydrolase n=1 Tax=Enterococcus ureasiticus TaxID=903984 RepID=UPI001A8C427D|nr:alpha/beta hydrolase [Enterococcus ureasiticus]MBO0475237.1 alpha/beta hydrolase [Enterococcus ureasiticus]
MATIDIPTMRIQMRENDEKRDAGLTEPDTLEIFKDLSYGPYGIENTFDIYYPKGTDKCLPTIINIHGGGFFYGDKELYRFYTMYLATQGVTVVNFNYRLAPEHQYPAPLEDTNALMNWLIKHGKEYHVDLDQLFLIGDSAGGQLVEQYATMISNLTYAQTFPFKLATVHFKAVAMNCGAYFIGQSGAINQDFPFYFGETVTPTLKNQFPVENYITAEFPPAFVATATQDFLKDIAQPLADLLKEKGIESEYHLYSNPDNSDLGHVFHLNQKTDIAKKCNDEEIAFFKRFL